MHKLEILNEKKKIVLLKWSGIIKVEEIKEVNGKIEEVFEKLKKEKFYLIVEMTELKIFAPDAKEAIIEQQKLTVPKLIEVVDVIDKALTKTQIKQTKAEANNIYDHEFKTVEEARKYFEKVSIYV